MSCLQFSCLQFSIFVLHLRKEYLCNEPTGCKAKADVMNYSHFLMIQTRWMKVCRARGSSPLRFASGKGAAWSLLVQGSLVMGKNWSMFRWIVPLAVRTPWRFFWNIEWIGRWIVSVLWHIEHWIILISDICMGWINSSLCHYELLNVAVRCASTWILT